MLDRQRLGTGNCFEVAISIVAANPHALLCHGVATGGVNGEITGWHGWVEHDIEAPTGTQTVCVDRSNGQDGRMRQSDYYAHFKIEHVTRYTRDEAMALRAARQTDGPWL